MQLGNLWSVPWSFHAICSSSCRWPPLWSLLSMCVRVSRMKYSIQQINKSANPQISKSENRQTNKSTTQEINTPTNEQINKPTHREMQKSRNQQSNTQAQQEIVKWTAQEISRDVYAEVYIYVYVYFCDPYMCIRVNVYFLCGTLEHAHLKEIWRELSYKKPSVLCEEIKGHFKRSRVASIKGSFISIDFKKMIPLKGYP